MAPGTFHLSTFALCTLGTGLQSASANAINQVRRSSAFVYSRGLAYELPSET